MKYHELKATKAQTPKRVGRGIAAGQGKTAGRGTKGQKARTGFSSRAGFAGGSNPLMQRMPKLRGFRTHKIASENVFTNQLNDLKAKRINTESLAQAGLISSPYVRVKLLSRGELSKALTVELQAASQSALQALESAGGSFTAVPQVGRPPRATASDTK